MQQGKEIQVCKFRKPEADTIMNDKVISEQRYTHVVKSDYNNGGKKGLPVHQGTNGM